jgi:hypothetical protein
MAKTPTPKRKRNDAEVAARKKELQQLSVSDDAADKLVELSRHISSDVPEPLRANGAYEPGDDPRFANRSRLPVKDGVYRVAGHDWLMTIKAGRVHVIELAQPTVDPKSYVAVPND